jgi:hypothetical protein
MLLVFLFVQQNNCLWLWLQYCLQLKKNYNHTVTWLKFNQNILKECGMPYIWNTQILLILIGLQMRLINSNNHGTLQSKIHQKIIFYRCFKETFEFEKKYLEILDHKYLFDFSSFELATRNFRLSVADGKT